MLQKLENAYLAILRFVVILVAGILLVAVVVLGLQSFQAIQIEPKARDITPTVSAQELVQAVTEKSMSDPSLPQEPSASTKKEDPDPLAALYERTGQVIVAFVEKNSNGAESVDSSKVIELIRRRAESFDDNKITHAFANGCADSIIKTLADPVVIKEAQTSSAVDVVNKVLNAYSDKFREKIEMEKAELASRLQEQIEKKARGMTNLYFAAGAFIAFLLIVFLSIVIKIERNLRHLENRHGITP